MTNGQLFVPSDFLEECRGWQELVSAAETPDQKDEAGHYGCQVMRNRNRFFGQQKVIVRGMTAYMLLDGLSSAETIWPMLQFDDLRVVGDLGQADYFRLKKEGAISWALHNAQVVDRSEVELGEITEDIGLDLDYYLPASGRVDRPIYFPVSLIDYALPAA